MRKILTVLFILFLCTESFGAPAPVSVSGSVTHDGSITISGSGFSTKSPVAPYLWDATDDDSTSSMATYYCGLRPVCSDGNQDDAGVTGSQPRYSSSYPDVSGTPMTMPHDNITKYIATATSSCSGSWSSDGSGNNVFSLCDINSSTIFAMYYYRLSPTFNEEISADGSNMKEVAMNSSDNYLADSPQNYLDHCNSDVPNMVNPSNAALKCDDAAHGSACSGGELSYTNPMQTWVHMELRWDTSGNSWAYSDGSNTDTTDWCDVVGTGTIYTDTLSIGGFTRFPLASTNDNYRYWAGIYVDKTYSRVMLGNASTWAASTVREPQIPHTTWNDTTIQVTVNLGALSGETAYLYVFDSNNDSNTNGLLVSLSDEAPANAIQGVSISNLNVTKNLIVWHRTDGLR